MSIKRNALRPMICVVVLVVGACTGFNATGYYQQEAEAACRARGLQPATAAFAACVNEVTSAEYRRWSRGAPGG